MTRSSESQRSAPLPEAALRAHRWLAEIERQANAVGLSDGTWPTLKGGDEGAWASAARTVRPVEEELTVRTWPGLEGEDLALGTRVGAYRLEAEVGRGAYGSVYRARPMGSAKPVAVKVMTARAAGDQVQRERMLVEARAMHRVRHPAVVDVYDVGLAGGRPYLAMELLEGWSLHEVLRRTGPLDLDFAIELLAPIGEALDVAHRCGVVHRDLKPSNIFVELRPTRARLLDFGVASVDGLCMEGEDDEIVGTPRYMAPEQVEGHCVSPASDIYSFGVLMFEVLTGRPPFVGGSPIDLLCQHVGRPPPAPSALSPRLSSAIDAPLLRMLSKEPADRQVSFEQAFREIRGALIAPG